MMKLFVSHLSSKFVACTIVPTVIKNIYRGISNDSIYFSSCDKSFSNQFSTRRQDFDANGDSGGIGSWVEGWGMGVIEDGDI